MIDWRGEKERKRKKRLNVSDIGLLQLLHIRSEQIHLPLKHCV